MIGDDGATWYLGSVSRRWVLLASLLFALVLACNGDGEDDNPFNGSPPPSATQPAAGPSFTPSLTPSGDPPATEVPPSPTPSAPTSGLPEVSIDRVFADLGFDRMTGAYQDGAGNWYVTEQIGRISRIPPDGQSALVLDLTDRVSTGGNEEGLLGFALSPGFAQDGVYYVYYSAANPRRSVVSRFMLAPPEEAAAAEEVFLEVDQPASNHNAGQIAFGPDGYLYVALGDGGTGGTAHDHGQDLSTLLGSILRIDVSGGDAGYDVPVDNPFVGRAGALGEIWAYGFRNPWRFSFDRVTGEVWAGDVGAGSREEIDLVVAGGNYGWRVMEGSICLGGGSGCNPGAYTLPVFEYETRSGGTCSVTGGFVYRGSAIPALRGAYVFSDYCSGAIYALRANNGVMTEQAIIGETGFRVSSLAEDNDGELYFLEHAGVGGMYKLVPQGAG
jgi:glucose/arabinose dehydrogenase